MTSRRASSTSAALITVSGMLCSFRIVSVSTVQGVAQCHPSEKRALDTRRILPHSYKSRRIAQEVLAVLIEGNALVVHEGLERLKNRIGVFEVLADDQVVEHRNGSL